MHSILLTMACTCGNLSFRDEKSIIIKPKFHLDTKYNTSLPEPIIGMTVICVACGAKLELMA